MISAACQDDADLLFSRAMLSRLAPDVPDGPITSKSPKGADVRHAPNIGLFSPPTKTGILCEDKTFQFFN
jgi:hypothetical protein